MSYKYRKMGPSARVYVAGNAGLVGSAITRKLRAKGYSQLITRELEELDLRRQETVGPKIGKELRGKAVWAVLWALVGIMIYVSWRYEFKFAVGAVLALFHDIVIVLGVFSVLNMEISLTIIAAFLTIGGYSINDTIVVFDRIREQMRTYRREKLHIVFNMSVNQVLSRTVITSLTSLFAVGCLLVLGGEVLHDFAFAILIGIVVGTYSSIFVASASVLEFAAFTTRKRPR